ncbi:DUF3540 domain-containing protein [Variovorax sp. MHTC-1]|uniref:DUF3540 domain-containing protein n=1 Tax=Variovorax sp. MHTC-1 TaxID=2495593 RepID=UPI000F87CE06|nr:DUF3540 domain-containing protein [Variovorax sp. MHTC-1]RST50640.1 DUF3540 domain-containing protein [Variovorax sp. MHTC-1]
MEVIDQREPKLAASPAASAYLVGSVVETAFDVVYVSFERRVHEAARAFSCMVVPEPGDEVGLFRTPDGRLFMTAVLSRASGAPLTLHAPEGFTLKSDKDIRLEAQQAVHLQAATFAGQFDSAHWAARLMRVTGVEFVLRSAAARLFAEAAEAVLSRLQVSADRSYRHIAQAEHVRTGILDVKAEHVANIRAGTMLLSSRELTKVDGAQIHVG